MQGYGGRLLFVDCATGATRIEPLAERTARALLGGNGLAARVLLDHVPAGIDAFDPANAVVFAVGPVTDTTVPGNSRACVAVQVPAHRPLLRLHLRGPLPGHAQAHRLRRRRPHRPGAGAVLRERRRARRAAEAGRPSVGALDAGGGECAGRGRGRGRGRHRHRPGRRAARALRRHGPLLEEPRGRVGAGWDRRGARQQERQGGGGARHAQDRDRRPGRAQGAARGDARAAAHRARRRCPPSARRFSSARSTRWARSAATTSRARSSPRPERSAASR